ncbi:MAG: 4-(cytidine 5'-diphospho)-2-C-methyl-D-erythritol kinase [Candidatus Omnitrophota bacterium]
MSKLILKSYAKLNLFLEVLRKRPDNYHDINTLFERIDLFDIITLKPRPDKKIQVRCPNPLVPKGHTNLCYRSAKLLQDKFKKASGVDIAIKKRIPVGAGLGGGSGNAASVFLGLNRLWKLNASRNRLAALAKEIGCDIPFFIHEVPFALGSSRGDRIRPLKALKRVRLWHIIVVPGIHVSTPFIYKKWDTHSTLTPHFQQSSRAKRVESAGLTKTQVNVNILLSALKKNGFPAAGKFLWNSLAPLTLQLYPEVNRIKEKLAALGLKSILMSGSGPAVFGVVSSRKEAVSLGCELRKRNKSWKVFAARTF